MKNRIELIFVLIVLVSFPQLSHASNLFTLDIQFKSEPKLVLTHIQAIDKQFKVQADSIAPDTSEMRNITSVQMAKEMVPGWNVGNSLEALPSEISWGNPKITQILIDAVKASGFNSIRIPVAWSKFTDAANYVIDEAWLDRVEDVVNYVLSNGMYAIINEHWDNGWIEPTYSKQDEVNKRLAAMWKQIATRFRDYDDHLLFAGTNEVHVGYGTPTKEYYTVQNSYNQTFVNAVRSTGGRNYYRHIVVQGYNTNIDHTINYFVIPHDVVSNRLFVEVHYYDPYNFTLNENSKITQWGKYATVPSKTETWANEAYADAQFKKMKTKFIDKGYAVILGEYGAIARTNLGSDALNAEHAEFRKYYIEYITGSIVKNGLVPYYWDNGGIGNNGFGLFNRANTTQAYPDIVEAIINAADTSGVGTAIGTLEQKPANFSLSQNYPNPFNPETMIAYQLPSAGHVTLKIYDILGREVATLVNNFQNAGNHTVQLSTNDYRLSSGIYIYKISVNDFQSVKKMILMK